MSNIISYGLLKHYSRDAIEDRISFSDMFRRLENSDSSFLNERTMHQEIGLIYSRDVDVNLFDNKSSISYWLGEAYIRLFFRFHKSIYYIFLYLPLEEMVTAYRVYHEMDWSELYSFFQEKIESKTLLNTLIKKRDLSVNKVSSLTGISSNTIQYYCLDDNHLYEAKYTYIYQLAICLKVNSNVFAKEIHNYINSGQYHYDKTNPLYRSYLGLNYASYYSLDIKKGNYVLDKDNYIFTSGKEYLKVLWTKSEQFVDFTSGINADIVAIVDNYSKSKSKLIRANTILVIFEFNKISQSVKPYADKLLKYGYKKVFIINQESILCVGERYWISYLTDSVNSGMIERAQKEANHDFVI